MASIEEALKKTKEEKTLQILEKYFNFKKDFIDSITLTEDIYNLLLDIQKNVTNQSLHKEIEKKIQLVKKLANGFFDAFWNTDKTDFFGEIDLLKIITHLKEIDILAINQELQTPFQYSQGMWGKSHVQNGDFLYLHLDQQKESFQHILTLSDLDFENYKGLFIHDYKSFQYLTTRLQDYIIFQLFDTNLQKLKEHSDDLNSITTWLETYNQIKDELPKAQIEYNTLKKNTTNLYQEIELLRQGVISEGLAKRYTQEKKNNNRLKWFWTILAGFGLYGLFFLSDLSNAISQDLNKTTQWGQNTQMQNPPQSLSDYALNFLKKSPAYLALVWFILFASRRRNEANRLASDYAHKEVFASSYEAYQEEIKKLKKMHSQKAEELTELNIKLLDSMISVLSDNPAKSLDTKKTTDELPAKELVNFASEIIKLKDK